MASSLPTNNVFTSFPGDFPSRSIGTQFPSAQISAAPLCPLQHPLQPVESLHKLSEINGGQSYIHGFRCDRCGSSSRHKVPCIHNEEGTDIADLEKTFGRIFSFHCTQCGYDLCKLCAQEEIVHYCPNYMIGKSDNTTRSTSSTNKARNNLIVGGNGSCRTTAGNTKKPWNPLPMYLKTWVFEDDGRKKFLYEINRRTLLENQVLFARRENSSNIFIPSNNTTMSNNTTTSNNTTMSNSTTMISTSKKNLSIATVSKVFSIDGIVCLILCFALDPVLPIQWLLLNASLWSKYFHFLIRETSNMIWKVIILHLYPTTNPNLKLDFNFLKRRLKVGSLFDQNSTITTLGVSIVSSTKSSTTKILSSNGMMPPIQGIITHHDENVAAVEDDKNVSIKSNSSTTSGTESSTTKIGRSPFLHNNTKLHFIDHTSWKTVNDEERRMANDMSIRKRVHFIENCDDTLCPSGWESLKYQSRESENLRVCQHCRQDVFFVEDIENLSKHVKLNHKFCVGRDKQEKGVVSKCCRSYYRKMSQQGGMNQSSQGGLFGSTTTPLIINSNFQTPTHAGRNSQRFLGSQTSADRGQSSPVSSRVSTPWDFHNVERV